MLPQEPQDLFGHGTVEEELKEIRRRKKALKRKRMEKKNEIVLFETDDKEIKLSVPVDVEQETVWLIGCAGGCRKICDNHQAWCN